TTVPPSLAHSTSMSNSAHSTSFLRPRNTSTVLPRQHSYTTGFGNALNIETLVAAAEQRDNTIEVGIGVLLLFSMVCSRGRIHNVVGLIDFPLHLDSPV
uniref:Uncharacterized protein n=1 Tax=Aegilops tauschii subsp. strangulata TaxID=200361 RepID=A0A453JA25_AEGTS